jgi:hypothetical protein
MKYLSGLRLFFEAIQIKGEINPRNILHLHTLMNGQTDAEVMERL